MLDLVKQFGDNTMTKKRDDFTMQTDKGYDFFEASSAFQKCVRRNLEDDALYWATEFINANYDNYLWKRILIITMEDVGLANENAPAHITGLYTIYQDMKKRKDKHWKLATYQAIIYLCRSDKSRLIDWTKNTQLHYHRTKNLDVPDFALDIHTRRGKMMGKTINDFFTEGSKLEPHVYLDKEKEREQLEFDYKQKSKADKIAMQTHYRVEGKKGLTSWEKEHPNVAPPSTDDNADNDANIGLFDN